MPLPKLKNLLEILCYRFANQFLALAIVSKNNSKTVCETRAKWLIFGAVSETQGLASD